MKRTLTAFFTMLAGIAFFVSCSKGGSGGGSTPGGGTGGGTGGSTCVTSNMKFSTDISPILSANCTSCHSGATPPGGINLSVYAGVKAVVDNGKLIGAITHASGFKPMPDGGGKLSDCNIAKIQSWVTAGALNN